MTGNLFATKRMQMDESIRLTADSLTEYGRRYDHWCLAWSGGKDSTTALTVTVWMIESGMVPRPKPASANLLPMVNGRMDGLAPSRVLINRLMNGSLMDLFN